MQFHSFAGEDAVVVVVEIDYMIPIGDKRI
jgi:hypothetical protein